jgi:hypothetical protein
MLESSPGLDSGGKALVRLVEGDLTIDAVFRAGDVLATEAVLEADRRGWKVPERVAIAGSDDDEFQADVLPSADLDPVSPLRDRPSSRRHGDGPAAAGPLGGPSGSRPGYEIIPRAST